MSDPSLEIQKAQFDALREAPMVTGGRVYDRVPDDPQFPYSTIGDMETVDDANSCFDATRIIARVHIWSREVGWPEAKRAAAEVRKRCAVEFNIMGFRISSARHVITRYLNDPDGLTRHAVCEFEYLVDHDT